MILSPTLEAFATAASASIGGGFTTCLFYPLHTIRSKLACLDTKSTDATNKWNVLKKMLAEEGIHRLYSGAHFKIFQSMFGYFFYFYSTSYGRSLYEQKIGKVTTLVHFIIGYICEFLHVPITQPIDVLCTRLQSGATKGNMIAAVKSVYLQGGMKAFYKGVGVLPFICFQPAIQNVVFDTMKKRWKGGVFSSWDAFWLGAFSRAIALTTIFPAIRAKTIIQTSSKNSYNSLAMKKKKERTMIQVMKDIVKRDGFLSLYRGIQPELLRGVVSSAIMLMIKEKIYKHTRLIVMKLATSKSS